MPKWQNQKSSHTAHITPFNTVYILLLFSFLLAKILQAITETIWRKKISEEKSDNAEKNRKGDRLVSPGIQCYAGKKRNNLYSSVP